MNKPDVDLWDKEYPIKMREWVDWHVEHTEIDNLQEFMQMAKGRINPQHINDSWENKHVDTVD